MLPLQARKLYYQPNTGTYYEYDERTKTHKVHSRVNISQYNTQQGYNYPSQPPGMPRQQHCGQHHQPPLHQSHQHHQQQAQQQNQQHSQQQPQSHQQQQHQHMNIGRQPQKVTTRKIDMFGKLQHSRSCFLIVLLHLP